MFDAEPSPESFQSGGFAFLRGGWVCAGGLDTLKIDKNSTDLSCFMFQFGWLGAFFGGLISPMATGLI